MSPHEGRGAMGRAEQIPVPEDRPDGAETVTWWLIHAPRWAPWLFPQLNQWILAVVRLRDGIPGFPPPNREFPEATHELMVATCNPEARPITPERLAARDGFTINPILDPPNVVVQVTATDDEMRQVADLAARAVADGVLCPEAWSTPSGSARQLSDGWRVSITKTLAHVRGEVHEP